MQQFVQFLAFLFSRRCKSRCSCYPSYLRISLRNSGIPTFSSYKLRKFILFCLCFFDPLFVNATNKRFKIRRQRRHAFSLSQPQPALSEE